MFKFTTLSIGILLLLNYPTQLLSQESVCSDHLKGLYSIQFAMDKDFEWRSFEGSLISLKYNMSPKTALRLGISPMSLTRINDMETDAGILKREVSERSIRVALTFIQRIRARQYTSFYVGGGPIVLFSDYNEEYTEGSALKSKSTCKKTCREYGLQLILGAEVFIKKYVSLFVEYGAQISKNKITLESDPCPESSGKRASSETMLLAKPVELGISIYF
ncbi:hypothetical protein KAR48_01420 [bacterium]|nr:hypothetical protein [bacterium]